jgi:RHS repeat-associated protein
MAATRFMAYDGNGNIVGIVNGGTGKTAATMVYSPFGELIAREGDAERDRYGFSTKWGDGDTGTWYYGYRFYVPMIGRWSNRDPIEERGGINSYSFSENSGVDYYDVLGLAPAGSPPLGANPELCRCNLVPNTLKVTYGEYSGTYAHYGFDYQTIGNPFECTVVQWMNGGSWNWDMSPRRTTRYGVPALNDTKGQWWIDSTDKDPRYEEQYWTYGDPVSSGYAFDEPGFNPTETALYQIKFKMCVYHNSDVPKAILGDQNQGGYITTRAIECIDWEVSILVDKGAVLHPPFWHSLSGRK